VGLDKHSRLWKSWETKPGATELVQIQTAEFPEPLDGPAHQFSRRSFLKAAGFTAAVTAAGCSRAPVEKAIPFLIQPEEIVPGVSYYYASGCPGCSAGCGVLVKTRDGRPVKLEGNPQHPISQGGLCAIGQASLLELYDSHALTEPYIGGKPASWAEVDRRIIEQLAAIRQSRGAVRFLSTTITSPTMRAEIRNFLGTFADGRHVTYDPLSSSAILDAHELTHGARVLPRYLFGLADVIVSFDADFLGTWISPVEFTESYHAGRRLEGDHPQMSYHAQFESRLSLTGSKADRRYRLAPRELQHAVARLAEYVAKSAGASAPINSGGQSTEIKDEVFQQLAQRLWNSRGQSLVVSGSQDRRTQVLINFMNATLGNYAETIDLASPSLQKDGNDGELQTLIQELQSGSVAALFIHRANPVYDLPGGAAIAEAIRRTPVVVDFANSMDETASASAFVCPDQHALESWGDAEPVRGVFTLFQPAVHPLANRRPAVESLYAWRGEVRSAYDAVREHWQAEIFPRQTEEKDFQTFWDQSVESGYAEVETLNPENLPFRSAALQSLPAIATPAARADEISVVLYPKISMTDGAHAENAWLQELPDPITKIAWDNYACISPKTAGRFGVKQGDLIGVEIAGSPAVELPVCIQPGQHDTVIAIALGYGRTASARFAGIGPKWWFGRSGLGSNGLVGTNAYPLLRFENGNLQYVRAGARITKTDRQLALASTQDHHTLTIPNNIPLLGGTTRDIVHETTLAALIAGAQSSSAGSEAHPTEQRRTGDALNGMWKNDHAYSGHHWAIAIDLTACTGCSACVVACQAENNIPAVGKDEVLRHREMHWLRIDRYYSGEDDVDVVYQPMMCQQCGNAPCETVCPVLATVHSSEGLNQQVYNRCVGTRYCANNCPYKTRRFNWFNYAREDRLQNLMLNPDVTVRTRGVMEKCSFCVQRIEAARIASKRRGDAMADGQIQTACQQSCPAQAMVFGDLNDPESRISKLTHDRRRFAVLEEFNFRPSVNYLAVVRNRSSEREENNANG
jgi:MoCo/4Fe-4S cofactor protein with predicted Tat translocation signal